MIRLAFSTQLKFASAFVFGFFGFVALGAAQPPQQAPFVTHSLKPNVYWVEGGGGNSGVIVGTNEVTVIDAKTTLAGGKELLDAIAKITPKPVTTVILTHSDGDHVNGLAAFPGSVKVIAHENNKKEQEAALAKGARGAPSADHLPNQVVTRTKNHSRQVEWLWRSTTGDRRTRAVTWSCFYRRKRSSSRATSSPRIGRSL